MQNQDLHKQFQKTKVLQHNLDLTGQLPFMNLVHEK